MEGLAQAEIVNLGIKGLVLPAFAKVTLPVAMPVAPPTAPPTVPPAAPPACIVVAGGVYLDELHHVPAYPGEDATVRASVVRRRRGGNAATTAVVLAELLRGRCATKVRRMGPVPDCLLIAS